RRLDSRLIDDWHEAFALATHISGEIFAAEPAQLDAERGQPLLERRDEAAADGIARVHHDDWDRPRLPLKGSGHHGRVCQDDVGLQADQLLRERSYPIDVTAAPTKVHPHVAAIGPTQVRKRLHERRLAKLHLRIVFVERHEHADAPYAVALLRTRRERPRRRTPEPHDKVAPSH